MSHLQYHIETFGCQMNVYDSELVAGLLKKCGYSKTEDINQSDIILAWKLFLDKTGIQKEINKILENTDINNIENLLYELPYRYGINFNKEFITFVCEIEKNLYVYCYLYNNTNKVFQDPPSHHFFIFC